ncbi:MAG: GxxExxY protein [Rhodospirillales bacterium]|nr:GxxExxY protein [Rhodospirillales bacterium]MCB9995827.1 GxxExxY protein [Rhodospirillales bacterium]
MHPNDPANLTAEKILDSAFKIHRTYGPGLLESAYEHLLVYELSKNQGLKVESQKTLPIHEAQLLTYLKLSETRLGLLLNFKSQLLKQGIKRLVL